MKIYYTLSIIICVSLSVIPKSIDAQSYQGEEILMQPGARAGSLGDAYSSLAVGAYSTYYNPAGSVQQKEKYHVAFVRQKRAWYDAPLVRENIDQQYYHQTSISLKLNDSWAIAGSYASQELTQIKDIGFSYRDARVVVGRKIGKKASLGIGIERFEKEWYEWIKFSTYTYSFGYLHQGIIALPVYGKDTTSTSLAIVLGGINGGIKFVDAGQSDPFATYARLGLSTVISNTSFAVGLISFDARKVLVNATYIGDRFWFAPLYNGWDTEATSFHFGTEWKIKNEKISLRFGKSYERDSNPRIQRWSVGLGYLYRGIEINLARESSQVQFLHHQDYFTIDGTRIGLSVLLN